MVKKEHLIIRLSSEEKQRLQSLSKQQDRPVSRIVREGNELVFNKYSKPYLQNRQILTWSFNIEEEHPRREVEQEFQEGGVEVCVGGGGVEL